MIPAAECWNINKICCFLFVFFFFQLVTENHLLHKTVNFIDCDSVKERGCGTQAIFIMLFVKSKRWNSAIVIVNSSCLLVKDEGGTRVRVVLTRAWLNQFDTFHILLPLSTSHGAVSYVRCMLRLLSHNIDGHWNISHNT